MSSAFEAGHRIETSNQTMFGALDYKECVADDVDAGKTTSFPRSVKLEDDEVVVFSWITYEEMADESGPVMDPGRMFFGGFEVIVDA